MTMKKTIITAAMILSAVVAGAAEKDSAQLDRLAAENRALRATLAECEKRIETLTKQVARLAAAVDGIKTEVRKLRSANADLRAKAAEAARAAGPATPPQPTGTTGKKLVIRVQAGGWGGAGTRDIQKVALSAGGELWKHFPGRRLHPIIISHSNSGPIILFRRGPAGEYLAKLDVEGTYWAQLAYQFAHEFCHILANYGTKSGRKNKWFEESLCEMASLFALRRMAVTWKTAPPYPHWKSFAPALHKYAENLRTSKDRQLPAGTTLAKWYRDNEQDLRKNPSGRTRNGIIANQLLGLFEASPQSWAAVGYLNLDKPDETESFKGYLESWHGHCPEKHKKFVRQIANLFEIEISPAPKQK